MQSNSFEYKTLNEKSITIKYDHSAVTTGGGGKTDEPAWSFRLWNGSIYLSRYLETIASSLRDETAVDLGSGTGLTSIVLGTCCQVKRVYATDLSHAMPLLTHNISENMAANDLLLTEVDPSSLPPRPPVSSIHNCDVAAEVVPTCPGNHVLTQVTADCEDYMCNVCDFDIDEDSCIHRCVECNFDICVKCIAKLFSGDMDSFPQWFRLLVQASATRAGETSNTNQRVVPFVYDWGSSESLDELTNAVVGCLETDKQVRYLIGADVTYSMKSIDLFFAAVTDLAATLRKKQHSSSAVSSDITLLFAHHNRSDDTNDYMMAQLQLKFEGKFEEISFQALLREDREDAEEAAHTGEMQIFRVSL
jgi:hypothetical protein